MEPAPHFKFFPQNGNNNLRFIYAELCFQFYVLYFTYSRDIEKVIFYTISIQNTVLSKLGYV